MVIHQIVVLAVFRHLIELTRPFSHNGTTGGSLPQAIGDNAQVRARKERIPYRIGISKEKGIRMGFSVSRWSQGIILLIDCPRDAHVVMTGFKICRGLASLHFFSSILLTPQLQS
jgi:hypothetical protein